MLLQPIIDVEAKGVKMKLSIGCVYRVIPIIAAYIADFLEQCLAACCMESQCVICQVVHNKQGENIVASGLKKQETGKTADTILKEYLSPGSSLDFEHEGLQLVYLPFWKGLKMTNIFEAFTPDLLHQVHKGVFKDHLFKWIISIMGNEMIDT